jgi:hypothetical protein
VVLVNDLFARQLGDGLGSPSSKSSSW